MNLIITAQSGQGRRSCSIGKLVGPWSITLRPEVYWDEDGVQTGFSQFIRAMTATLEYKISAYSSSILLRLEYRYDRSTGRQGGFFNGGEIAPGVIGLTPDQQLLIFAAMWNFDSDRCGAPIQ